MQFESEKPDKITRGACACNDDKVIFENPLNWERPPCTERKSLNQECGWKDGDRGGPARMRRNPQEGKRKQKEKTSLQERRRKTSLTLTGLLMEGARQML